MWWRSANSAAALLLGAAALAQPADELLVRMRRAWQDQSSVFLKRNTTYVIERGPQGWTARRTAEEDELMLKDQSGAASEKTVHYSGLVPLDGLVAYTLVPDGRRRRRMPVGAISHRDAREGHIFHDDDRVASFTMPGLVSGAIAHVSHGLRYPDARFAGGHFFATYRPSEESTLTVISDPGAEVEVRLFHAPDSLVLRSEEQAKGRRVQRFTMRKVPPLPQEPDAPGIKHFAPHAQLVVRLPEERGMSDLDRLYAWYSGHIKDTFAAPPPALQALSDSICRGAGTPRAKAERLYRWVQASIHYVAIEDGMNGLVPMPAEEVRRTRYGDCKGMSNLLRQLLRAQGLEAHLAWVGTRELPYAYTELATGASDNHMIVALELEGDTLFLDPTAAHNAFGVPSGFTQGKQSLIALGPGRHALKQVPVMPPSFSTVRDSVRVRLEGDALVGTGVAAYTGYERYALAHRLRYARAGKLNEALRPVLMKGSNKFLLDSAVVEGLDDPAAPLTIRYAFRLPDHARAAGGKRYLPLQLSDPWKELRQPAGRGLPVELEHKVSQRYVAVLELPPAARCSSLPASTAAEHDAFRFSTGARHDGATVTSVAEFALDTLLLDASDPGWRAACSLLLQELGRSIVIESP